jgi:uncharacterized protein YdhG (YjbR/CyaY superfamily)
MEKFKEYISSIENVQNRNRVKQVLEWVQNTFPDLETKIGWNQPMFTSHGTFIIGFSIAKHHMAVTPEIKGMMTFNQDIAHLGYSQTERLFRIKWDQPVDYKLLTRMIEFNVKDKKNCTTFWR